MLEKIIDLLYIAARNLERPTQTMRPDLEHEDSEEEAAPDDQTTPDSSQGEIEPPPLSGDGLSSPSNDALIRYEAIHILSH